MNDLLTNMIVILLESREIRIAISSLATLHSCAGRLLIAFLHGIAVTLFSLAMHQTSSSAD
jgi:hypothetical protein